MTAPDTVLTDLRSGAPDRVLAALDAYDDCAFDLEHLPYPGPDPAALGAWPAGPPNEVVRRFVRLWLDGDYVAPPTDAEKWAAIAAILAHPLDFDAVFGVALELKIAGPEALRATLEGLGDRGAPRANVEHLAECLLDGDASIRWVAGVGFAAWPEPQRGWAAAVFALRDEPFPG
jgi:hypothetical protein